MKQIHVIKYKIQIKITKSNRLGLQDVKNHNNLSQYIISSILEGVIKCASFEFLCFHV